MNSPTDSDRHAARLAAGYWLAMLLALGWGAALVCRVPNCSATPMDQALLALAHAARTDTLDRAFGLLTWGGSLLLLVPVTLAFALRFALRRRYRDALFLGGALAGGSALAHAGKLIVARPRPDLFDAVVAMPLDHAYPSAHSAQITACAVALILLVRKRHPEWLGVAAPLALLALGLIALSRVYLQVHYPSDVIAGIVTSTLWVAGLAALLLGRRD